MHEEHPHKVLPYLAICLVALVMLGVTATSQEQTWGRTWARMSQGNKEFGSFLAFAWPGDSTLKQGPQIAGDYTSVNEELQDWWETPWDPLYAWLAGK